LNALDWARGDLPPDAPVFREPWEAQAFALVVALHERGVFTWSEWTLALSAAIHAEAAEGGGAYYQCWLRALERLVGEKGLAAAPDLSARKESWRRAVHATPHGAPILLENDPLGRAQN
jgi:nitrile hydratase accessory protein